MIFKTEPTKKTTNKLYVIHEKGSHQMLWIDGATKKQMKKKNTVNVSATYQKYKFKFKRSDYATALNAKINDTVMRISDDESENSNFNSNTFWSLSLTLFCCCSFSLRQCMFHFTFCLPFAYTCNLNFGFFFCFLLLLLFSLFIFLLYFLFQNINSPAIYFHYVFNSLAVAVCTITLFE